MKKLALLLTLLSHPALAAENILINSGLEFFQRGTSITGVTTTNTYGPDRFKLVHSGSSAVYTVARSTSVATGSRSTYAQTWTVTTADASIAATEHAGVAYVVEGSDLAPIKGKALSLSFWVKSSETGAHCISFTNNTPNRYMVKQYTVNSANTWEKKVITFQHDPASTASYLYTQGGVGMIIRWVLNVGSTYAAATDGTWGSTQVYGTSSCGSTNVTDTNSNVFAVQEPMIYEGHKPIPWQRAGKTQGGEAAAVCRYFWKTYALDTKPATATATGAINFYPDDSEDRFNLVYPCLMAKAPTVTIYSTDTGTSAKCFDAGASSDLTASAGGQTQSFAPFTISGTTVGNQLFCQVTADAEL